MTPATNDIMAATPYDKAGIGSAVNDTSRELGAALGIATLGALSTSVYRSTVDVGELPAEVAAPAAESIGAALEAAHVLSGTGVLSEAAARATIVETGQAFTTAFAQTMAVSGVVSAVAAARPAGRDTSPRPAPARTPDLSGSSVTGATRERARTSRCRRSLRSIWPECRWACPMMGQKWSAMRMDTIEPITADAATTSHIAW